MLLRKMLRDFKRNFFPFFSVFMLAALAMALFSTFEGHVLSQGVARKAFHDSCKLSDLWVYGESFSEENLEAVRKLPFVEEAGLRTAVTGSAPNCGGAQVDLYLERENVVNTPYLIEGEEFDPSDTDGIWLSAAFADRRELQVGDRFTVEYDGVTFTKEIRGLIESAEYEYRQADGDADVYLENIAIAYMSYDGFPVRDYLLHMIDQGKIDLSDLADAAGTSGDSSTQVEKGDSVTALAGAEDSAFAKEVLRLAAEHLTDEQLADYMPYTQLVVRTSDGEGLKHEKKVAAALDGEYSAMVDEDSIPGLARLNSELEQHQSFSWAFVVIFVGIAILVIATSMKRMVEQQRPQIGTMNALGVKKWKIMLHYIGMSLAVAVAGVIVGMIAGVRWGSPYIITVFAEYYIVPGLHSVFHPVYLAVAAAIVASCILSGYLSCRKVLKIKPAEALRPAPPRQGTRCLFERLPFWQRLSFGTQYNLRDISRAKLRTFMCVIGTAVGMLLMVYGVGCGRLVDTMMEMTFDKVTVSEYQVKFSSDVSTAEADRLADRLDGELVMAGQIEVSKKKNPVTSEKKKENITVLEGMGLYNILDLDNEVTHLKAGYVGVSRKLSEDLDIQVGDTIYWHLYEKNTWYSARVGMIYRSSDTQGIAYLRKDYEKTGADYTPALLMTDQDPGDTDQLAYVSGVNSKAEMEDAFMAGMEMVSILVWMMIAFSTILIVVVLYNSGSLSFNERVKEFATLKVLGFRSSSIRSLLTRQNLWLSVIGIILGTPLGNVSLSAMMNSNGDNFDYYLKLPAVDYAVSAILVMAVSLLVGFLFSGRIRKLDMVTVLKGTE